MSIIDAAVIGCSAGGLQALQQLLEPLPAEIGIAIVVVSHSSPNSENLLPELLARSCRLPVLEAMEREPVRPGKVHVAPPNYHLLIEQDRTFSLSVDAKVCNVRPAADLLFVSAARVYRQRLAGLVLTGANSDGAKGLAAVAEAGGVCLVQNPATAVAATMPQAAIAAVAQAEILSLAAIAVRLMELSRP